MKFLFPLLLASSFVLTSCTSDNALNSSANVSSITDETLYNKLIVNVTKVRSNLPSDLSFVILSGRVLVVGYVSSPEEHINLINALWKTSGVSEVVDHLELATKHKKDGFPLSQALLRAQIDAKFVAATQLRYKNFKYTLFKGNVYVLACPDSSREKDTFFQLMKTIPSIGKVYFYDTRR